MRRPVDGPASKATTIMTIVATLAERWPLRLWGIFAGCLEQTSTPTKGRLLASSLWRHAGTLELEQETKGGGHLERWWQPVAIITCSRRLIVCPKQMNHLGPSLCFGLAGWLAGWPALFGGPHEMGSTGRWR